MAKQLGLEQAFGNGRAINGHQGLQRPPARLVNRPRDQLLSRAALAADQHRRIRPGHLRHVPQHLQDGVAFTHDVPEPCRLLNFLAEIDILRLQPVRQAQDLRLPRGQIATQLLDLGVGAIKVDFGEAAPASGIYASGKTGFYEHNLYPLRYNKALSDITFQVKNERIIWARSTWAGSQRYPVHWGGDPANTYSAMSATLRAGLSLGLCGFSYWSHDIGGFVQKTPENVYRQWTPFGMLTSHVRSHGAPPTEPWEYGEDFMDAFRKAANLRYTLMPYIYAQAHECSANGLPMVRALFVEFPEDPGSWLIDNQYMFGSDILVGPLFSDDLSREMYLPPGTWIDYQTGKNYSAGWHHIESGDIPIIILIRDGAVIPHIGLAQSTKFMDWSRIELAVYSDGEDEVHTLICLPDEQEAKKVVLKRESDGYKIFANPFGDKIVFNIAER